MNRWNWDQLPVSLRDAVQDRTGRVHRAESVTTGRNSQLVTSLQTMDGRLFCKGVRTSSPSIFMHRNEETINPFLPADLAPRLRWSVERDGWLLLVFEHVPGRHVELSPHATRDLAMAADAVHRIAGITPLPAAIGDGQRLDTHWAYAVDAEVRQSPPLGAQPWSAANAGRLTSWARQAPLHMRGTTLIHADLNPLNILVGASSARVIDWAWWRVGAAWVDPAFLVVRLIAEGHTPAGAEKWAQQFDAFRSVESAALTAFAASLLRLWERRFAGTPATLAAQQWTEYRLARLVP